MRATIVTSLLFATLFSVTIEEKKEQQSAFATNHGVGSLAALNDEMRDLRVRLEEKYAYVSRLKNEGADEDCFQEVLAEVNGIKREIGALHENWRKSALADSQRDDEGYAFWDQEETTLSQMVMEYGATDFLYVIPQEMQAAKLHLHSSLPIPRESWGELLELMLAQNGIGVRKLNPYAKQLYYLKHDLLAVSAITNQKKDLTKIPEGSRIIHILSPPPERARSVAYFFERFRDIKKTHVTQIGYKVAIVAQKEEVEKLISLYDAVWEKESEKTSKVIPLTKMQAGEMEKILKTYFGDLGDRNRVMAMRSGEDLSITVLPQENAIVLVGMKEVVKKAEKIITETEDQVSDPCEMTVYWYTCRHSDPIDLSEVLQKVYESLVCANIDGEQGDKGEAPVDSNVSVSVTPPYYNNPGTPPSVVNPPVAVAATAKSKKRVSSTTNFIPYAKTGSIMMVVRKNTLPKIKELVRKLDIPKKMVQIEVLLFEKKIKAKNNFGLNVLKLGNAAKNVHETGLKYDSSVGAGADKGILNFFISRAKSSHFPAYDLAYNFLMAQEDVRINASPSVTTVNQTPAQVSIVEEISINNGAAPVTTNNGLVFQDSYTRSQYGITLTLTPTIHEADPFQDDAKPFISMTTDISFDTINSDINDRPKVNMRHIVNEVRVQDGETVILGGLRQKKGEDNTEKIPFLGEIPGIAKFFGTSRLTDDLTEMFIFVTPRILTDSKEELDKMRDEEVRKRPGDLPEFLQKIMEARQNQKRKVFENSFKLLFGNNESSFRC